jgi:toxin-antitoxin system PIN domain toxin
MRTHMTLSFPDLNVWVAIAFNGHPHSQTAWNWMRQVPDEDKVVFTRYTQIGLLRLLTNSAVMGDQTLKLGEAWDIYDRILEDPRVEFYPEPRGVSEEFRKTTKAFATQPATKAVGDCWLLANALAMHATLITFDRALYQFAKKREHPAVIPS